MCCINTTNTIYNVVTYVGGPMNRLRVHKVAVKSRKKHLFNRLMGKKLKDIIKIIKFRNHQGQLYMVFRRPFVGWLIPTLAKCVEVEVDVPGE